MTAELQPHRLSDCRDHSYSLCRLPALFIGRRHPRKNGADFGQPPPGDCAQNGVWSNFDAAARESPPPTYRKRDFAGTSQDHFKIARDSPAICRWWVLPIESSK